MKTLLYLTVVVSLVALLYLARFRLRLKSTIQTVLSVGLKTGPPTLIRPSVLTSLTPWLWSTCMTAWYSQPGRFDSASLGRDMGRFR